MARLCSRQHCNICTWGVTSRMIPRVFTFQGTSSTITRRPTNRYHATATISPNKITTDSDTNVLVLNRYMIRRRQTLLTGQKISATFAQNTSERSSTGSRVIFMLTFVSISPFWIYLARSKTILNMVSWTCYRC